MLECGSRCAPPRVGVGEIVRVLCVGVGTVLGLGWRSCCLVCHVVGCLGQSVVPFLWMLVMG